MLNKFELVIKASIFFNLSFQATKLGPILVGPKLVGFFGRTQIKKLVGPFFSRPSVRFFFEKFIHKGRLIKGQ